MLESVSVYLCHRFAADTSIYASIAPAYCDLFVLSDTRCAAEERIGCRYVGLFSVGQVSLAMAILLCTRTAALSALYWMEE